MLCALCLVSTKRSPGTACVASGGCGDSGRLSKDEVKVLQRMANDDIMPRMHADPGLMTALLAHINADILPGLRSCGGSHQAAAGAAAGAGGHEIANGSMEGQSMHAEPGSNGGLYKSLPQQGLAGADSTSAQHADTEESEGLVAPAGKRLATAEKVHHA